MLAKNGMQSCDQCNFQRIRCCRVRPSCEACAKKGLQCTWNRELKSRTGTKYQNVETFRASWGYTPRCRWIKQTPTTYATTKLREAPPREPSEENRWDSCSPRRHLKEYFTVQMRLNTCQLSKRTARALTRSLAKLPLYHGESRMPLQIHVDSRDIQDCCRRAMSAYFNQIHPFFNIFNSGSYAKSHMLKLSVVLCGLQLLPKSQTSLAISSSIVAQIACSLCPSRSPNTLETAQSLLVLLTGLPNPLVLPGAPLFRKRASLLVVSLGIHLPPPPHLSDEAKAERSTCFRAFLFISYSQTNVPFEGMPDAVVPYFKASKASTTHSESPEQILGQAQASWAIVLSQCKAQKQTTTLKLANKFQERLKLIASIAHHNLTAESNGTRDSLSHYTTILNLQYKFVACQFANELPRLNLEEHASLLAEATASAVSLIDMVHQNNPLLPASQVCQFTLAAARHLLTNYHSPTHRDHHRLTQSLQQARDVFRQLKSRPPSDYVASFHLAILDSLMATKRVCLPAS